MHTKHGQKTCRLEPLGRHRRRWYDNTGVDLKEVGWEGVDRVQLAQDMDQWRVLVNRIMNLGVP
jgi:hypothetical protein